MTIAEAAKTSSMMRLNIENLPKQEIRKS